MMWQPPLGADGKPCVVCIPAELCPDHKDMNAEKVKGPISIFTWERAERFLEAKRKGSSDARACARAPWSREVYQKWKQEITKGICLPAIRNFIMEDVPQAESDWYERALDAIGDGLDDEDVHKAAKIGLEVIDVFFPQDHMKPAQKHEVTGEAGGPVEFRIVFDDGAQPPKSEEKEEGEDE